MKNIKVLCNIGIGTALYVALSAMVAIPLVANMQLDLGYVVFGVYCALFGYPAIIVGVVGCMFHSLIFSGWIPTGWMVGQAFIGFATCFACKNFGKERIIHAAVAFIACIVGVGLIKTEIECALYSIPVAVKIARNAPVACIDGIVMTFGMLLADKLNRKKHNGLVG